MGNREDLMAGAKRCLNEKGYRRTTARDIASTSGVSLAAIGYHFGTKDALLNLAMIEAMTEWGDQLRQALTESLDPALDPLQRFAGMWDRVIAQLGEHRGLWAVQFEITTLIAQSPALRETIGEVDEEGRLGLAEIFAGPGVLVDREAALNVGSFYQALLIGVMGQCLANPDRPPTGKGLAAGLRAVMAAMAGAPGAPGAVGTAATPATAATAGAGPAGGAVSGLHGGS